MPTASINHTTLAYDSVGQGPPLLFLHGIFVSRHQWYKQLEYFAPHHQVIACDLRGHGESGITSNPYSTELFAEDVIALLDSLKVDKVVCVGHSFGGMVAQEMALHYPERVRGLILLETSFGLATVPWDAAITMFTNQWLPMLLGRQSHSRMLADYFSAFTPQAQPYMHDTVDQYLQNVRNGDNILQASLKFNSRWRLHEIRCPTLIMIGQYYHIPMLTLHGWEMFWRIMGAIIRVIPNAGHLLHWDNPDACHVEMTDFLEAINWSSGWQRELANPELALANGKRV